MKRWLLLSTVLVIGAVSYFFFYKKSEVSEPAITSAATESTGKESNKKNIAISYGKPKSTDELKYETVADLAQIADDIKSKAEAGDVVALRIYGKMLEECWYYSNTNNNFKAELDARSETFPQLGNLYSNFGARIEKRCKKFTGGIPISSEEPYLWFGQAAMKKDGQSMAKVLSGMGAEKLNDQALKEGVDAIIASKDPEAIMELANTMGDQNQSRASVLGKFSGSRGSEYAWRLAACRLGANCKPYSPILINLCLNGGAKSACTGSNLQEVMRIDVLSPAEYAEVLNLSTGLMNSLNNP